MCSLPVDAAIIQVIVDTKLYIKILLLYENIKISFEDAEYSSNIKLRSLQS